MIISFLKYVNKNFKFINLLSPQLMCFKCFYGRKFQFSVFVIVLDNYYIIYVYFNILGNYFKSLLFL